MEVWVSGAEDSSCMGACYLGLNAIGAIDDYSSIESNFEDRVLPIHVSEKIYKHNFEIYRSLYPALKEMMKIST
jgi:sugar (pentulose or hexulose) kinase